MTSGAQFVHLIVVTFSIHVAGGELVQRVPRSPALFRMTKTRTEMSNTRTGVGAGDEVYHQADADQEGHTDISPAPTPASANMSDVFESYLAHVQERNFSAIRASSVQDDPGMRYSTSEPGGGNTHSIETFYGQWNSVGGPSLKMSRLVDNVATVPKFGFALWGGRRMRGTTDIIHYLVHEMVLFTDSGEIKSIESFINRNKWEYCPDGCSVTKDGDAPPLQLAYENLSSPVAHSSRTAFEGGETAFGYTSSPVVAAKDRFWSAWKGSSRDEFIKIFAEEAQLMIFDDCAETGKVMTLQGLDGAGMMFDHFLAGTSPYHTGWSLPAEYFNRVGIFGFGFDCAATRPCWFSSTVVLTESDTSEPKILFLLGSWERWNAPDSFSCSRPQQRARQSQGRLSA